MALCWLFILQEIKTGSWELRRYACTPLTRGLALLDSVAAYQQMTLDVSAGNASGVKLNADDTRYFDIQIGAKSPVTPCDLTVHQRNDQDRMEGCHPRFHISVSQVGPTTAFTQKRPTLARNGAKCSEKPRSPHGLPAMQHFDSFPSGL